MRVCEECGKANQDLRKFCIRCGAKLVKAGKATEISKPSARETGKVTTKATYDKEESKEPPPPSHSASVTTEDRWVRPSEVSRDRVRKIGKSRGMTELEKAQEAFRRAEEVGFDEPSSGVVESRMLRASDVRGLLEEQETADMLSEKTESSHAAGISEPMESDQIASESIDDESDEAEKKILGSHSAIVRDSIDSKETEELSKTLSSEGEEMSEFRSARYQEVDDDTPVISAVDKDSVGLEYEELADADVQEKKRAPVVTRSEVTADTLIPCPNCGEMIVADSFDYPSEVYSAMGHARLKQARFFVVQGKDDEAMRSVRIARFLFEKSQDEGGLKEVSRLVDSMAKSR